MHMFVGSKSWMENIIEHAFRQDGHLQSDNDNPGSEKMPRFNQKNNDIAS